MQLKHQADVDDAIVSIKYQLRDYETIALKDVANKIRTITDEIAPGRKINTDDKIDLQITSKNVPDLTLIDLPGIAYSDDTGGGREVADRIKNLWTKYIEDEGCVILCVVPANTDIGTQEAYTVAKEVDPSGKRTIGVVTKIDTIEEADGPTIVNRLNGEGQNAWRFDMGCHAIRNRNQTEIKDKASREEVDASEELFFSTHKELSRMPENRRAAVLGFDSLVKNLIDVQSRKIREAFPKVKKDIRALLEAKTMELNALPSFVANEVQAQNALRKLTTDLRLCIDKLYRVDYSSLSDFAGSKCPPGLQQSHGMSDDETNEIPKWLEMMPRLQDMLEQFEKEIRQGGRHIVTQSFGDTSVTKQLGRLQGYVLPDLTTLQAVQYLAKREAVAFEAPATNMLESVHAYFSEVLTVLVAQYFSNYPRLREYVQTVVDDLLTDSLALCRERLTEQIAIEQEEVYTLNHYYSDTVQKVMARLDEIIIGEHGVLAESVLQAISEGQPRRGTVIISGAIGAFEIFANADFVNGKYEPVEEVHGGELVYKKNQPTDQVREIWLEFNKVDIGSPSWALVTMSSRTDRADIVVLAFGGSSLPVGVSKGWTVYNGTKFVAQEQVTATKLASAPATTGLLHNNFERSVKETQIRLWCYRKVVHKCFCDSMAKFVRLHFPRKLKDHLEEAIFGSLVSEDHHPGTGGAIAGAGFVLAMMAETTELATKRQRLTASSRKLSEALDVMTRLERR